MPGNHNLELEPKIVETLEGLPELQVVGIQKFLGSPLGTGFSGDSIEVLNTIRAALPGLVLDEVA